MRDLTDLFAAIRRLVYRVDRLESGAMLENSSISSGRMRFIGGTLRVDSGGRVEIVGTLQVDGETTVTGQFTVDGPWTLTGAGDITGEVTVTGPFTVEGPWSFTGDGEITGSTTITGDTAIQGDVDLTGKMSVQGEIDVFGAGKIKVGSMTLDPSARGGSIKFTGGPEVYAAGGELSLYSDASFITLDGASAKLNGPGTRWVEVTSTAIRMVGMPTTPIADWPGSFIGAVVAQANGTLMRVVA